LSVNLYGKVNPMSLPTFDDNDKNHEVALARASQGFRVFPCNGKHPCYKVYWRSQATTTPVEVDRFWGRFAGAAPAINVGPELVVVDADLDGDNDGMAWLLTCCPEDEREAFAATPGCRTPSAGRHLYFRNSGRTIGCGRGRLPPKHTCNVDIKGSGGYVIAPGADTSAWGGGIYQLIGDLSALPELPDWLRFQLEPAAWECPERPAGAEVIPLRPDPSKANYGQGALTKIIAELAAVQPGSRSNELWEKSCKAGELVAGGCFSLEQAIAALEGVAKGIWGLLLDDKALGPQGTIARGLAKGMSNRARGPDSESDNDDIEIRLKVPGAEPVPDLFDPWLKAPVPKFPLEVLPDKISTFVSMRAQAMGCDPSGLAMAALGTLSGALHHEFSLKMNSEEGWWVSPRLWIMLLGTPSTKKTPILKAATKPLRDYEAELRKKYLEDLAKYEEAKNAAKGKKKIVSDGDEEAEEVQAPVKPPRYLVWDATPEALGRLLNENGTKGTLLQVDELAGWLTGFERYNKSGTGRAFFLAAYDGGHHSIERIGRGSIFIENLSASVLGSVQPERMNEIKEGLDSDGLLQRFLVVLLSRSELPVEGLSTSNDSRRYHDLVHKLATFKPARLILDGDAPGIMRELQGHLLDIERASEEDGGGFSSFVGKLAGVAGTLALILHIAHCERSDDPTVEGAIAAKATRLVMEFILPHAREFYSLAEDSPATRTRNVASWLLTSKKTSVVASELKRNVRCCRGLDLYNLNRLLGSLVAGDWLVPADKTPVCRSWQVNRQIHTQFAGRAAEEGRRKATLAALMGSPRMGE
jgi:hypothetical protein